jgi:hypothetical protein
VVDVVELTQLVLQVVLVVEVLEVITQGEQEQLIKVMQVEPVALNQMHTVAVAVVELVQPELLAHLAPVVMVVAEYLRLLLVLQ